MAEIREPAVAGRFYPAEPKALDAAVRAHLASGASAERRALAVIAPHAGYMYSGAIAGLTYASIQIPDRVIVLCPNHTGRGARKSVSSASAWRLPGGAVPVDDELRELLVSRARLELDHEAHEYEHAVEVQLPFLRAKNPAVRIVAICLGGLALHECHELGGHMASVVRELHPRAPASVLVVASSDMSHYLPEKVARTLDWLALDHVLALDPDGLFRIVRERNISMCGYLPVTTALVAARELGGTKAELLRYGNSGEVSGDNDRVVGYAGVVVS